MNPSLKYNLLIKKTFVPSLSSKQVLFYTLRQCLESGQCRRPVSLISHLSKVPFAISFRFRLLPHDILEQMSDIMQEDAVGRLLPLHIMPCKVRQYKAWKVTAAISALYR